MPTRKNNLLGFTLIELAIVLGVIGVMAAGLFRLMSTGGQQTKDQATAQQHQAIIAATAGFLAETSTLPGSGQGFLTALGSPAATTGNLPLPSSNNSLADCQGHIAAAVKDFCNFLPPGFTASSTNPYGQQYQINVLKDGTAQGVVPQTYSFVVATFLPASGGGSAIPDIDGGRISNLIGGDGGFIYSANVCGGPSSNLVCGTMNAFTISTLSYAFNGTTGTPASRTFVSPGTSSSYFWLARQTMPNDSNYSYNTMQTYEYMNNTSLYTVPFGTLSTATNPPGPGNIYMNTGTIYLNNSSITGSGGNGTPQIDLGENGPATLVNLVSLSTACTGHSATCPFALNVIQGDIGLGGNVYANTLYSASDARMKINIHKLDDPLADLMKIDAVSFTFKEGGHKSMGVTAQQLEKVYPELVSDGDTHKFVDYNGLIGPLIGAVQELKRRNDGLEAQIHDQQMRQDRLEQDLHAKNKQTP